MGPVFPRQETGLIGQARRMDVAGLQIGGELFILGAKLGGVELAGSQPAHVIAKSEQFGFRSSRWRGRGLIQAFRQHAVFFHDRLGARLLLHQDGVPGPKVCERTSFPGAEGNQNSQRQQTE